MIISDKSSVSFRHPLHASADVVVIGVGISGHEFGIGPRAGVLTGASLESA
jgi:hypothetical protein